MGKETIGSLGRDYQNLEVYPQNLPEYRNPEQLEKIFGLGTQYIGERLTEKIIANTSIELPEGFNETYDQLIKMGYVPMLTGNHISHADGGAISKLTRYLTRRANGALEPTEPKFRGFNLPLAMSLLTGHQGWLLRRFFHYAEPVIEKNKLYTLPLVREKDEERYGMQFTSDETKRYLNNLKKRVHDDGVSGIVLFPEGTTIGGQTNEDGSYVGMVKFDKHSVPAHARMLGKYSGKKVMIIPVGITGGSEVVHSNNKLVPLKSFTRIKNLDMFNISVGEIIATDSPEFPSLKSPDEINEFVGKRIADELPFENRGVYA